MLLIAYHILKNSKEKYIHIQVKMQGKKMVALLVPVMVLGLLVTTSFGGIQIDDITCSDALQYLEPCLPFLVGSSSGQPTAGCCEGTNTVFHSANTTQVRRELCKCFKEASTRFGFDPQRVKQLPQFCHISLSFPIDPRMDCNS